MLGGCHGVWRCMISVSFIIAFPLIQGCDCCVSFKCHCMRSPLSRISDVVAPTMKGSHSVQEWNTFSFSSSSFFFLSLHFRPCLFCRSLYISVSAWGEEEKWSRQEIYPCERQVWINKEEVCSALPEREGWREMREGFFFFPPLLQAAVRFWEDNEHGRRKVKKKKGRKRRGEGRCGLDGW